MRTPSTMSPSDLYDTAVNTLKLHAISVAYEEGEVKIYADSELKDSSPRFIPSRARSSVPAGLQPIVQYVEIYARDLNDMANILNDAFPDQNDLTVRVNRSSNSLTIAGLPQQTAEALRIIEEMDELGYAGTDYAVYRSINWDAEDLGKALEEILRLNGLTVSSQRGVTASVNIKPIEYTQQLYIFARRADFLDLAIKTVRMLDTDATPENVRKTRVYKAKYYKAEDLVAVLQSVSQAKSGVGGSRAPAVVNGTQPPTQGSAEQSTISSEGGFVVDAQGNRVIFEATNDEYAETMRLLNQIDVPASEVLIEVTIAEVTLTDDNQYGMEFLFNQLGSRGFAIGFGTAGGLGLGDGGFSGSFQSGDYVLDFSALATNQQINVLSTPRLVTKSGASANIQVGTDVP
ncbi:MAG: secretin N-terminal domain-containing protein, partial [Pseudomonadota bacterium]|nr:secretin N-terminal domain-containing protein [Pseudomonadota bacterium]